MDSVAHMTLVRYGLRVTILDAVRQLTTPEKLELLENLWSELAVDDPQLASPSWHKEALAQSQADYEAGRAKFSDWNVVKERLGRELSSK